MDWYSLLKAFHIIAVVCWFAALFYLPRLFIYHISAPKEAHAMLCTMEAKLYRVIMLPSMMAVWVFGLLLLTLFPPAGAWIALKFVLVILLTVYQVHLKKIMLKFAAGTNTYSEKFLRLYNEVPAVLLIIIVLLAVLKPF